MAESENIVVETAEKIFADLADTQTINRDKEGKWKAPLWQALTDAGLPLSWVPEECGGSGASMADGFGVLGAAGRFAIAVPLACDQVWPSTVPSATPTRTVRDTDASMPVATPPKPAVKPGDAPAPTLS